ncbi:MAG: SPFH domain-containing protein, partial [Roseiflexaceae bacterium]|nr:SPFH domain-containing protein [Roseiflexaceae bacterium]
MAGRPAAGGMVRILGAGVLLLAVAAVAFSLVTYEQIDEGERGIVIVQGAVTDVREPGIFFSLVPFTRVAKVNIKRQTRQISQNVASSDKQLYDIDIAVDYSRNPAPEALQSQYGQIGVSDEQLNAFLDGFINDALKSASTQFTLDQVLVDRGGLTTRISQLLTTPPSEGRPAPIEQLFVRLDAVKVIDVKVGEAYAKLLGEKANLEVQIETEEKRRQQIEVQQANNLFQAEQESKTALIREQGATAAALEAASRESQVRSSQGRYYRENPELLDLRQRELMAEMVRSGNIYFVDPNTNLTLLLDQMAGNSTAVIPQPEATQLAPTEPAPS